MQYDVREIIKKMVLKNVLIDISYNMLWFLVTTHKTSIFTRKTPCFCKANHMLWCTNLESKLPYNHEIAHNVDNFYDDKPLDPHPTQLSTH